MIDSCQDKSSDPRHDELRHTFDRYFDTIHIGRVEVVSTFPDPLHDCAESGHCDLSACHEES